MAEGHFDTDLIVNMDETTTNAEKTKKAPKVLYEPGIGMDPVTMYGGKTEQVTMISAVTASGKRLIPVFIIKNKTVTTEVGLRFHSFNCGEYLIGSSPNGWQDNVSNNSLTTYSDTQISFYDLRELSLNGLWKC